MKTVFTVTDPVFKTETLFVLGCPFDEFSRYMARRQRSDVGEHIGQIGQMLTFADPPYRCVWVRHRRVPVLIHEMFHLVTRICQDRGIPIRSQLDNGELGDETAAYLTEFFAAAALPRLRK